MGHSLRALRAMETFLKGNAGCGGPRGLNEHLADARTAEGYSYRAAPDVPVANYEIGNYRANPPRFPWICVIWDEGDPLNADMANGTQDNVLTVTIAVTDAVVDRNESGSGIAVSLYEDAICRLMRRGGHGGEAEVSRWEGWSLNDAPGVVEARLMKTISRAEPELQHGNRVLGAIFRVRTQEN